MRQLVNVARRRRWTSCAVGLWLVAALLAATGLPDMVAHAEPPSNSWFTNTWSRTDQPVADLTVSRTWMWGAEAFTPALLEDYTQASNGQRAVQYFDKSRMEINPDPAVADDSPWHVTNGLLVVELMSGRMQVGNNDFVPSQPADVNVAGDPDDTGGVTYRFMGTLTGQAPLAEGVAINWVLSPAASDPYAYSDAMLSYGVIAAHRVPETGHTIAGPFWDFMNSSGIVDQNGSYVEDRLFQNPFYATGYPLTEAYWANVKLAGVATDVLIQCFERRCLTYTPSNAAGWQVEAGNVGQHYYAWRYTEQNPPTPAPGETPTPTESPEPGATGTATSTGTATATGTSTSSPSPSSSPSATGTGTGTSTSTATSTSTSTSTPSETPSTTPQPTDGYAWRFTWTTPAGSHPADIDTDSSGNVYVANDAANGGMLSYSSAGALRWQMHASDLGYSDVRDVSVTGDGSTGLVCVLAAQGATTYVALYDAQGNYIRAWQTAPSIQPASIACDPYGYVTLAGGAKVAWFDTVGNPYGSVTITGKSFVDMAVDDATEETYLVDQNGPRIVKLDTVGDPAGDWGDASGFSKLAVDTHGNVYGTDLAGHRVVKLDHDGHVLAEFGTAGAGDGQFAGPNGVAVDSAGNVYVTDADTQRIQRFSK